MDWEPGGTLSKGNRGEIAQVLFVTCSQNENSFSFCLIRAPVALPRSEGFGHLAYIDLCPSRHHNSSERQREALRFARAFCDRNSNCLQQPLAEGEDVVPMGHIQAAAALPPWDALEVLSPCSFAKWKSCTGRAEE